MSTATAAPGFSLVAHIRRLSTAGSVLYIRIGNSDISRLGLGHGRAIEIDLGRVLIAGVVKTSGGSPWLAPAPGSSNVAITAALRGAHFEHGMDVAATARSLNGGPESGTPVSITPARVVARKPAQPQGSDTLRIGSTNGAQCVQEYNAASYRCRNNVVLDREAYSRFGNGLSYNLSQLVDQITFVGERYGGAQRFDDIRKEAELIANNLRPILGQWLKVVMDAKPLADKVPSEATLDFLFRPFKGTKRWPVWASKVLHFLRPDAFPILDSNAKKPLGLKNLVNSSGYHQFSSCFRDVLLANSEALAAARVEDAEKSPTDLKLLDKILFQLGLRMR